MEISITNQSQQSVTLRSNEGRIEINGHIVFRRFVSVAVKPLIRTGIIILDAPEKHIEHKVVIVKRRISAQDPRFIEVLGRRMETQGFRVQFKESVDLIKQKNLENKVRSLLRQLPSGPGSDAHRNAILHALPMMSILQLKEVKKELDSI